MRAIVGPLALWRRIMLRIGILSPVIPLVLSAALLTTGARRRPGRAPD